MGTRFGGSFRLGSLGNGSVRCRAAVATRANIASNAALHFENLMNFMKTVSTRVLLTAILAVVSHATHASATDEQGGVAVTVRYDDLNLSTPAGVDILKRRVSRAAEQVCGDQYGTDPLGKLIWQGCVRRATDNALARVNWPKK
jgi:UrcA family protein